MQRSGTTLLTALGLALIFVSTAALAQYQITNLNTNQFGKAAHTDPLNVNTWGLVHGSGSPWWVSDNNSGWSTLYTSSGQQVQQLKVLIPTAGENGPGSPTGIVFNGSGDFQIQGWSAVFLFATLDGTISGWAPQVNFNQSVIAVNNSKAGAMYTGLAISSRASGNFLYAADLANNKVDIYDTNFTFVKSFTDPMLPSGFAPFGIRDINGVVYVAFASVTGGPGGFVERFGEDGTPMDQKPFLQGGPLNQPWGIVMAPKGFGPLGNTLLISNNTNNGTINAFNPSNGEFVETVRGTDGRIIFIDQLWGIDFGDGKGSNGGVNQLFFAAGPNRNLAGLFGKIMVAP